jgi:PPOX class probable F420-dependent enzyme
MTTLSSDIHALIEGPNIAHVATLQADGAPHTVPVWIDLEDDKIAILTSPQSQKARNLDRDPRVAISITDRDQPTAMASIRGRVTGIIRDEPAWGSSTGSRTSTSAALTRGVRTASCSSSR